MPRARVADALAPILNAIPPASGAVVMGTGIVSIALVSLDGRETLSRILIPLDAAVWIALGLLLAGRALRDRERVHREARRPDRRRRHRGAWARG
jgi:tellurite resistance protein TehA-like permease